MWKDLQLARATPRKATQTLSALTQNRQIAARAQRFGARSDISARSVLVTIFGDSIAPVGGEVWLGDLIALTRPFGFSERLIRTSLYRLVAEGWCATTRVGRRSRYALTEYASAETADADRRIYQMASGQWDGGWTLVLSRAGDLSSEERSRLHELLGWRGFGRLSIGVWGLPNGDTANARGVLERLGLVGRVPIASAGFDDLPGPVGQGLIAGFGLERVAQSYRDFLDRYGWTQGLEGNSLAPVDAFALRTMLIHELRRPRLHDPGLPAALLPDAWVGRQAFELAAATYRQLDRAAWSWVSEVAGLAPTDLELLARQRFPNP